jgi:CRISPR-associated endonuclease Csn1
MIPAQSEKQPGDKFILGIDLGANSIGLALIATNPGRILHTTARVFPAGMTGSEIDWENGKEASNAAKRRQQRGQRRQTDRRKRRMKKLFHLLKSYGWLPDIKDKDIQQEINRLDKVLSLTYSAHTALPYFLRARGLDQKLDLLEFGRALYHLAQRRGFRSNRKSAPAADEDAGVVYAGIDSIRGAMKAANMRTLGEYFASLNPEQQKVRRNWTHRDMYIEEFAKLWAAQLPHHPLELTPERQDAIHNAIFFQRPLRDQSHLVGFCELETSQKRAPLRLLEVQRYRYLSALNNLRLYTPEKQERPITPEERLAIIQELDKSEKLTFTAIRKILGLKNSFKFSIEEGGEKQIPGNATLARIYQIVPVFWNSLSPAQQEDLVEDIGDGNRYETDEDLYQALIEKWSLTPQEAVDLSRVRLPADYASISLAAVRKLTPELIKGFSFASAKHLHYKPVEEAVKLDFLPPVKEVFREIRNPAVLRSLTELRKCVNAFIRQFGKPDEIHIELARELRRSKRERLDYTKTSRENEKVRTRAKEELRKKGNVNPSNTDIEKFILWEECGFHCPYSGKQISYEFLFDQTQFEIEHIIPYSRSLDNSRANKTLCHVDYNRDKGKRTPFEAFGGRDDWDEMVGRVAKFAKPNKLNRFLMKETDTEKLLKDFSERQLTDTKYASKLAQKYLCSLYGGKSDEEGMRIVTCAGAITAALRQVWDMNRILSPTRDKSRDDHRHHAVDAVAIALCSMKYIKALSDASAKTRALNPLKGALLEDPWTGFREELADRIHNHTTVGYRRTRKLAGPLHKETIYSKPHFYEGAEYVHIRKPVSEIAKPSDVELIVDTAIRAAIKAKLDENGWDPKTFASDPPRMASGVEIKNVRIRNRLTTISVADGPRARRVVSKDNHHLEVLAILDENGNVKAYRSEVVSRFEANQRRRFKIPVVKKDHGEGIKFLFSLSENDMVEFAPKGSQTRLFKVRGVDTRSGGRLTLSGACDARKKESIEAIDMPSPGIPVFMKGGGRKVLIDHLGNRLSSND